MRRILYFLFCLMVLFSCSGPGSGTGQDAEQADSANLATDSLKEVIDAWEEYQNLVNIHSDNYIFADYGNIARTKNLELDMDGDGYLESVSISRDAQKGNVRISALKGSYAYNLIDFVGLESTVPVDTLTQYQVSATDLDADGKVEVVLAIGKRDSTVNGAVFRIGKQARSFYQFVGRFVSDGSLVQLGRYLLFRKDDGSVMSWTYSDSGLVEEPYY